MRLGCVYKRFLNAIFTFQNIELYKGLLAFLETENDVQKVLLYKAQIDDKSWTFTIFDAIGLRIQTFSERDFRFPKS